MSNNITIKLTRPVDYEGVHYTELTFKFDDLTGRDITKVKRDFELKTKNIYAQKPVLSMDVDFAAMLAARAAGVPYGLMDHVFAPDYMGFAQLAINFLLLSGVFSDEIPEILEAKESLRVSEAEMTSMS